MVFVFLQPQERFRYLRAVLPGSIPVQMQTRVQHTQKKQLQIFNHKMETHMVFTRSFKHVEKSLTPNKPRTIWYLCMNPRHQADLLLEYHISWK